MRLWIKMTMGAVVGLIAHRLFGDAALWVTGFMLAACLIAIVVLVIYHWKTPPKHTDL